MNRRRSGLIGVALCLLLASGCGDDDSNSGPGTTDSGADASASADAGDSGGGVDGSGPDDAGTGDAGTGDTGTDDAGTDDAGTDDAGNDDAGTDDTSLADVSGEDASGNDANTGDVGNGDLADAADMALPPINVGTVEAHFENGANWNDYVASDPNLFVTDVAACVPIAVPDGYRQCRHAAVYLHAVITDVTDCTDLNIHDSLGAFEWSCEQPGETVIALSRGLKSDVMLRDLLDLEGDTYGFLDNSVIVESTGGRMGSSEAATWWANPVLSAADNARRGLTNEDDTDAIGTIYVIEAGASTATLSIEDDKIAITTEDGVGTVGNLEANPEGTYFLSATARSFLWIEGEFTTPLTEGGDELDVVIRLTDITQSVVRHALFVNGDRSLLLVSTREDTLHSNLFSKLVIERAYSYAFTLVGAAFNRFGSIYVANSGYAVSIDDRSHGNHLHHWTGATIEYMVDDVGSNNTFTFMTNINSYDTAFTFGGDGTIGLALTSLNAEADGFWIGSTGWNTFGHLLNANDSGDGVYVVKDGGGLVYNLAAWGNSRSLYWDSAVELVGEAIVDGCRGPNFETDSCTPTAEAAGDFDLSLEVTSLESFATIIRYPVPSDAQNSTDNTTLVTHENVTDWYEFETPYRGWGVTVADATWPDVDLVGTCEDADGCGVWDTRLADDSDLLRDVFSFDTPEARIHIWDLTAASQDDCDAGVVGSYYEPRGGGSCRSPHLLGAVEIYGDEVGNDNGLCEVKEVCFALPNYGSYQGHGDLSEATEVNVVDVGTFSVRSYTVNGIPAFE